MFDVTVCYTVFLLSSFCMYFCASLLDLLLSALRTQMKECLPVKGILLCFQRWIQTNVFL